MQMVTEYADVLIAVVGVFALGWAADFATGRRGLFASSLVAFTGAVCGWFVAVRVFGAATMDEFRWVLWAGAGAVVTLVAYFLFRSKR